VIEAEIAAQRHLERDLDDPKRRFFHGGALHPAEYEPPVLEVPTIKVCTLNGYDPELEEIRKRIVDGGL
jgi:hypothetical protein